MRPRDTGRKNLIPKNRETGGTTKQGGSSYLHPCPKYTGLTSNTDHDNILMLYKTYKYAFIYSVKLFYHSTTCSKVSELSKNSL